MADGVEIPISTPGFETLGEMRAEIRKLKKDLQDLVPGTKAFADLSKEIASKQDKVNDALREGWSEQAKLKDAYFKTGLEVRQLILSSGLLGKDMGRLGDVFSASVINAIQLRRQLAPLGIAIGGIGIGIAAAVSAGIGLISFLKESAEKSKAAVKELLKLKQTYIDLVFERDKADIGIRLREIDARISLLRSQMESPTSQRVPVGGGLVSGYRTVVTPLTDEQIKANQERENEIVRLEIEANNLKAPIIKAENDLIDKKFKLLRDSISFDYKLMSGTARTTEPFSLSTGKGTFFGENKLPSMWGSGKENPVKKAFKEPKEEASEFSQHMKQGFMSATGQLTQGFVQAFGMANNLANQLLATLMAAAAQALIIMGLRAGFNLISGGLGDTLFGAASSKGGGSNVPQMTPTSAQRSGGGGPIPGLQLRTEISGANLALIVESGNRTNKRRRF